MKKDVNVVDLRELFKKYLIIVARAEGVTFTEDACKETDFNDEEVKELKQIEVEAFPDENIRP